MCSLERQAAGEGVVASPKHLENADLHKLDHVSFVWASLELTLCCEPLKA